MDDILGQISAFARGERETRAEVEALAGAIERAAGEAVDALVDAGAKRAGGPDHIGCTLGDAALEVYRNAEWPQGVLYREEDRAGEIAAAAGRRVEPHREASAQTPYRADVIVRFKERPVHVESVVVTGLGDGPAYETAVIVAKRRSVEQIAEQRDATGRAAKQWARTAMRERTEEERPRREILLGADALARRWGAKLLEAARG